VARVRVLSDADVDLDVPAAAVVRTVDAPRIGQVVDNLLGNAVKYSSGPATVEVSLREDEDGVIVSVTDHGRGIEPDDLPHLFERGYRSHGARDVRGEGLGLSVVREIVEAHGGRVGASSPGEGRGSTFWILLPPERKGTTAEAPAPAGNGEADAAKEAERA
jgi:signal transduction histidine kinase